MAIVYRPNIVRDNLLLHYDMANVKSYPGSGNTWFDMSGNNYNAIRNGSYVSYDSNNMAWFFSASATTTDGLFIQDLSYTSGPDDQITNMTLEFWCNANTGTSGNNQDQRILLSFDRSAVYRFSIGGDSGAAINPGKPAFQFTDTVGTVDISASSYSGDLRDGAWHQVGMTFTAGDTHTVKFFIDGEIVHEQSGSYAGINRQTDSETPRYGIIGNGSEKNTDTPGTGVGPNTPFYGYIGNVKKYLKSFTPAEIKQNFEALRGRYGV